ncbi:hypothetical protein QCA50_003866 [Cerrena zonata]|uniref:Uncharacterized protein n=1 Tax=Cerrena zonata TaxID=2478898 RepID=A0AAW0GFS3_9APHY
MILSTKFGFSVLSAESTILKKLDGVNSLGKSHRQAHLEALDKAVNHYSGNVDEWKPKVGVSAVVERTPGWYCEH